MKFQKLIESSNKFARAILKIIDENSLKQNDDEKWVIGVEMKPSIDAIIAMLSIMKCGASYFPINPHYTKSRFQEILDEVQPQLVIVDDENSMQKTENFTMKYEKLKSISDELNSSYLTDDFSLKLGKNSEALTIYTAGTLGMPKGTHLTHANCQNRLEWQWMKFPFAENETHCISRISHCHVDHFAEIWGSLCAGKSLVILDVKFQNDKMKLIEILEKYKIQRFTALPSLINSIVTQLNKDDKKLLRNVQLWISTGEQLTKNVAENFFSYLPKNHKLVNFYGCTETTGEL